MEALLLMPMVKHGNFLLIVNCRKYADDVAYVNVIDDAKTSQHI